MWHFRKKNIHRIHTKYDIQVSTNQYSIYHIHFSFSHYPKVIDIIIPFPKSQTLEYIKYKIK